MVLHPQNRSRVILHQWVIDLLRAVYMEGCRKEMFTQEHLPAWGWAGYELEEVILAPISVRKS